jgi:hypothetical protein
MDVLLPTDFMVTIAGPDETPYQGKRKPNAAPTFT